MPPIIASTFGIAVLLALVSLMPPLAQRTNLPLTVLLASVGILLGIASKVTVLLGHAGPVTDLLGALSALNPSANAFLYIFLPILLFETALAIEVRRFMDDLAPILLLAVIAVLVSTVVVGVVLWQLSPMSAVACFLFSAIVATTDPAAVIGIFRDIGAPRRLNMLVEGESLLNDAAAIAVFGLMLGILTGREADSMPTAVLGFFVKFLGGIVVGYLCGRLLAMLVEPLHQRPLSEITLTVAFAYLSYILADYYLHVSGVMSVVTTALVIGSVGRTRISPQAWEAMETVWNQLGFWASSLIFLLAGMLIPPIMADLQWAEVGLIAAVAAAALAARAFVLFAMVPLLTLGGLAQRVGHDYKVVILWGGLRGAVSLALALSVVENPRVPEEIQHFVAVLATGYVMFTLFVQGTTLHGLISLMRLDRLSRTDRAIRNGALALSLSRILDNIETLAQDYQIEPDVAGRTTRTYADRLKLIEQDQARETGLAGEDRVYIGLVILVSQEEELYLSHFKEGIISRPIVEVLTERIGWLIDGVKARGREGYEKEARRAIGFSRNLLWALRLQQRLGLRGQLAQRLSIRFEALLINRMVLKELVTFNSRRLAPLLGDETADQLAKLLHQRLYLVEQALAAMKLRYPDYAPVLQHQYLGRAALRMEESDYQLMHQENIISDEILKDLERDLERRRRALEHPPQLDLGLAKPDLIARVPLFAGLGEDRLSEIARLLKPRLALPDEPLLRRGDRGGAMYFIAAGTVEVYVTGMQSPIQLGPGDFFGEVSLITREPRTADVRSISYCHLLELEEPAFRHLLETDDELRRHILSTAEKRRVQRRRLLARSRHPDSGRAVGKSGQA